MANYVPPPCPPGISDEAAALWQDLTEEIEFRPDELAILRRACFELTTIGRLEEAVAGLSTFRTTGSRNQDVSVPELSELRMHNQVFASLLGRLDIPDGPAASQTPPVRVPGAPMAVPMSRSEAGRLGGRARRG
jgi:hypothetical protein